jgi:protein-L-isoaspartate(D-aspartate) O-methyltransferase
MGRLDGKVALISGAASGLGAAEAELFAREGAHVVVGDIQTEAGQSVVDRIAAAGGEAVPQAWIDQLAVGGRIVAPTHSASGGQALVVIDKTPRGLERLILEAVHFVPLKSGIA